ncbi:heptosyltransferase [Selenomonas sp. oral taxon 920]|uniref:glycosyltransferase family 9 protein n=1 Tax=Selenomonas sp. oral taxon 920 TaxID=1884263 RepID=UPI000840996A|nr:glycosyltransferase family 9 protein [Selenomonas sp. oral taxon 920]AOH47158.1 heptosyltransferase [Selenomonas sp. oral taxon 920]
MSEYRNILVINLMHLGDLMLVTPVLRTLRHNYPAARITLLADRILADIVQENAHIDECLLIDKKGRDRSFLGIMRFARRLRERKYDLVVNLHRNERSSALAALSGGKRIVGYTKPGFSLLFDHVSPDQHMVMHEVHSHYAALRAAGIIGEIDDAGLEMWLPPAAEAEAARLWAAHFAPEDKVIALNIGASWRTKRWEDGYFAQVADTYLARGYHLAVMGGPTDVEMVAACRAQMREKDHPHLHIFTGQVSLGVLAGLLRRCILFITTDSGPMHVGVAMNVPVLCMFGASPIPGFYPYDEKSISVRAPVPCHPCRLHECPLAEAEYMKCMKQMPPTLILKYADQMLAENGERPACELVRPTDFETRVAEQANGSFALAPRGAAGRVVRPVLPAGLKAHGFD